MLLLTFGTLVAAGLPIATALFGLGISSAVVGLLAAVMDVPDWAPAVATMIGLGVGIDYALLILTRYRAALAAGREPRAAVVEAISTAGRSVLVAGTTVVISLLGLFLMGLPYLYGVALSAIFAVLIVMAASVTLLPALLGFAGRKIDRLRIPGTGRAPADPAATPAARWSRAVQRRPWTAAIAGAAVLLALAAPVLGLRLGFPDAGNDRADTTTRQAYDLVAQGFGAGANGPLLLVADTAGGGRRPRRRAGGGPARRAGRRGGRRARREPARRRRAAERDPAHVAAGPGDGGPHPHLREDVLPRAGVPVSVGGATAAFVDQSQTTADRLPLFIGGVVGLSFLLLLVAFRSVVVARQGGRDEPAVDRRGLRRRRVSSPRAAGPGSSSASTPRRRCRRSSR